MPIQATSNVINPFSYASDDILKSSVQESQAGDETKRCLLNEQTLRMSFIGPVKGLKTAIIDTQVQYVDNHLTHYFTPAAHRKAYLAIPANYSKIRVPFPVKSENEQID